MERWRVHKFGGSSVADAVCMERVARILEQDPHPRLGVVLSACRGVTDALLKLVAPAERQDEARSTERIEELRPSPRGHRRHAARRHEPATRYLAELDADCHDIAGILHTVELTRSAAQNVRDLIAGYGEIWSTRLFRAFFAAARQAPRRRCSGSMRATSWSVEWGPLGPAVQWDESRAKLRRARAGADFDAAR